MIRGVSITYVSRTQTGADAFNEPIYAETEETVENVLYYPASTSDLPTTLDLTGRKALYTLAIPKGDTHDWVNCTVRFLGHTWHSIGFPQEGIEANIPLDWNKKVTVELYG